ncbi:unnamed protein product [Lupinus luteus]|uniref:Uncharacterized protein n=1 Tax=Lupinus luteus TaxID=3873 RepID=A0AAV1XSD6_LUPLU
MMSTSRKKKSIKKSAKFSESEMEVAKTLLQLKNGYYSDHRRNNTMLQRKQHSKVDNDGDAASSSESEAEAFEREMINMNRIGKSDTWCKYSLT